MKKVHFKKLTALVLTLAMLFSLVGTIGALAEREYAADLSINGATVDFKNEPYSKFNTVFVPIEELCGYLGLDITRSGNTYTIKRMRDTLTMDVENIVININGKTVLLENGLTDRGGVTYAPLEIFSEGFKCPVTLSEDFRSADIQPNIYSVVINQDNAAAISAALPDKDTLVVSDSGADQLFYKPEESPEKEIAVFYKADLSDFANKKIASASLNLHVARGTNLNQSIAVQRTKPWNKGELNFTNQPAFYEGQQVSVAIPSELKQSAKNWGDMQFNITSLVNSAIGDSEPLAVKLLGVPFRNQQNPGTPQAHVKGVNTTTPPYISIEVNESYTFPVKKVEKESIDESHFDELQILRSLGVFTAEDEFPLDLTESVTRGEFLTYAMRLRGNNIPVGSSEQFFSDVPTDNGYFAVTSSAYELGYISGWQGIAFRPYDAITVAEAITILGRMLNYNVYADERGGFTPGYFQAAAHGDLYVGVNDSTTQLSFKQMFKLLEDALDAKMLNVYSYSSNGSAQYTFDENMTILTEYWNAEKIEGQITANEYSNIVPDGACSEGYITITTSTGATKKLRLNYEPYNSLLGFKVKGYYEKHENVLLYIGTTEYDVDEYDYKNITGFTIGSDIKFSYEKSENRIDTVSFSKSADIIYNGKSVDGATLELSDLEKDSGKVTIVNNNLIIITAYDTVVVESVNLDSEAIYDTYEKYDNLLLLKGKDYNITDSDGKEMKLENIKKYDVLSVAKSKKNDLFNILVTRKTISGKVEAIEDGNSADVVYTIGGQEYKTANTSSGTWKNDVVMGIDGTFYLNQDGVIVGFKLKQTEDMPGYLVAMGRKGGGISQKYQVAVFTLGNDEAVVYDVAQSVKLDGVKVRKAEDLFVAFTAKATAGVFDEADEQAILFSLNSDGQINEIDTTAPNADGITENGLEKRWEYQYAKNKANQENQFVVNDTTVFSSDTIKKNLLRYKGSGRLGDNFFVKNNETLVVMKPDGYSGYEDYLVSGLANDGLYNAEIFTVGKQTPEASVVVLPGDVSYFPDGSYLVFDRFVTAFDEDGMEVQKMYYYTGPESRKSAVISHDINSKYIRPLKLDDTGAIVPNITTHISINEIKRGDIVRIGLDTRGEVVAITEYYDYETGTMGYSVTDSHEGLVRSVNAGSNPETGLYGGYTESIYDDKYVKIVAAYDANGKKKGEGGFTETSSWIALDEGFYFYKYTANSSGVEVSLATAADIRTVDKAEHEPTGMLLHATYLSHNKKVAFLVDKMVQPENTGIYTLTYEANLPVAVTDEEAATLSISYGGTRYNPGDTPVTQTGVTMKNYEFTGWKNKVSGDIIKPGDPIAINDNTVLLAQWTPNPSIKFIFVDDNENPYFDANMAFDDYYNQYTFTSGTQEQVFQELPSAEKAKEKGFEKAGYQLIGWKGEDGKEYMLNNTVSPEDKKYQVKSSTETFTAIWMQKWSGAAASDAPEKDANGYYKICSGEDLAKFAQLVNGGEATANAILMNDIYLNNFLGDDGKPVTSMEGWYNTDYLNGAKAWDGYLINTYSGIFDGNDKSIYGLYIAPSSNQGTYYGMFKQVDGATIKNLKIVEPYLVFYGNGNASAYTGILIGGALTNASTIDNVDIDGGKFTAKENADLRGFGSIAGVINAPAGETKVTNCESSITMDTSATSFTYTSTNGGIGGIIGKAKGASGKTIVIDKCSFTGHINVPGTSYVGAIIGRGADGASAGAYGTIKNCSGASTASAATTVRDGNDCIFGIAKNATIESNNSVTCTKLSE